MMSMIFLCVVYIVNLLLFLVPRKLAVAHRRILVKKTTYTQKKTFLNCRIEINYSFGPYTRACMAVRHQAKFYRPRQAAAAGAGSTAAATVHEPQYTSDKKVSCVLRRCCSRR